MRLGEGSAPHCVTFLDEHYRLYYAYAIDLVAEEIFQWFSQELIPVPKKFETLLIKAANCRVVAQTTLPEAIHSMNSRDADMQKAKSQLQKLSGIVNTFKQTQKLSKTAGG